MMTRSLPSGESYYDKKWPYLRSILLKVLKQEPVDKNEWQSIFFEIHSIVSWDDIRGTKRIYESLQQEIISFIKLSQARVLARSDEQALLKTYIMEWRKFFRQSHFLPLPFRHLEAHMGNISALKFTLNTHIQGKADERESLIRKMMLKSWNRYIFSNIKHRLQDSAMKLIHAERNGDAFDPHLVIGVRESYVNLCVDNEDNVEIYRSNFEASYLEATIEFYRLRANEHLQANGVQSFLGFFEE